ncbi:hypothetical protein J5N97_000025 [Dioscorea zingiberensis]|uniref:Uncharacterized protein n=1 Tax=Dioscorea zingiberensis TaxID=325984 RepID=A0A9D5BW86_9LILI|nr:hypothetical protein J5N97_000025 [Dioscorea zingiberensis]
MGRGRGKGKKLTVVTGHDDPGSGGEESLSAYKRRGRPQKPLKDDIDEDETEKIEEEEGDDTKPTISSKEVKGAVVENGRKRKATAARGGPQRHLLWKYENSSNFAVTVPGGISPQRRL